MPFHSGGRWPSRIVGGYAATAPIDPVVTRVAGLQRLADADYLAKPIAPFVKDKPSNRFSIDFMRRAVAGFAKEPVLSTNVSSGIALAADAQLIPSNQPAGNAG